MTRHRDIDLILDDWFADGPSRIADRVVDDALLTIERTTQSRGALRLPRRLTMNGTWKLAAVAMAAIAVAAVGVGLISRPSQPDVGGQGASSSRSVGSSASPSVRVTPSIQPSPSPTELAAEGFVYPGRYVTNFQPGLTFTIAREVENGCAPGFRCRGSIDVNTAGWVGLEFGNDPPDHPRLDLNFFRVDKVYDTAHSGKLIDPPANLERWIERLPGVTVVTPATRVTVGGLAATQVDLIASKDATFAPIPGITDLKLGVNKDAPSRYLVLVVDGHQIVITMGADEKSDIHFGNAVQALQPLIDSILWG